MICIDYDSQNIANLLKELKNIPGVVQVRCHKPLRKKYIDLVGQDGVYLACMVPMKDRSDHFLMFEDYYTFSEADDPSKHPEIIATIQKEVEDYLYNDIMPSYLYERHAGKLNFMQHIERNFATLYEKLCAIPGIVQVRYHHPLKKKFVDFIGADGYIITAYTIDKKFEDAFVPFVSLVPKNVYSNLDKHDVVVEHLRKRVEEYINYGVKPPRNVNLDEIQVQRV